MLKFIGAVLTMVAAGLAFWFGSGTPLGEVIFRLHPPFLNTLQAGVQRRLSPALWDQAFLPVLESPAWLAPLVLGVVLLLVGSLRRRRG